MILEWKMSNMWCNLNCTIPVARSLVLQVCYDLPTHFCATLHNHHFKSRCNTRDTSLRFFNRAWTSSLLLKFLWTCAATILKCVIIREIFNAEKRFEVNFSAFAGILNGSVTAYDTRARFQITAPFFGPRIRGYLNTGHWWQSKPEW